MSAKPDKTIWESIILTLREKCAYSELLWSVSALPRISPHSVRMRENTDQNNPEYEHFLGSDSFFSFPFTSAFKGLLAHCSLDCFLSASAVNFGIHIHY